MKNKKNAHWNHLLHLADELAADAHAFRRGPQEIEAALVSLEEVFTQHADPIEDFQSYALLRFARRLRAALAEVERGIPLPVARRR